MSNSLTRLLRPTLLACLALLAFASAASAQQEQVFFFKVFLPDTIGPGSVSTLLFELSSSEDGPVIDLAFTDTLPAGVVIATPPNAATTCGAGAIIDAPAGGSTISFSGGQLPATPEGEEGVDCVVTVDVTSSVPGTHANVSGDLTSSLGNHGDATADLTVTTGRPGFTKSFAPNPITVGQTSTLTFTIDNTANGNAASFLNFSDTLPAGLVVASPANAATTCGGILTASPGAGSISLSSGSVAAGSSCTVTVDVTASLAGSLGNTSGELTSTTGGPPVSSGKASAVLEVVLDSLAKVFTDDPVPPGGTVTLELTITNFDRDQAATDLSFTDDLDAALTGLVAVPPLPADPCGAGSTLSGTAELTLTGGSLPAEGSCTFAVTLQVPAGATPGSYPNTTSPLTATVGGEPVVLNAASDDLVVTAEPVLTKEFTDDPVIPGATATLEFTLTNTSTTSSATDIAFTDDLAAALPGLAATVLPAAGFCGPGSTISGTSVLSVSGASLAAAGSPGDSCTFQVTLQLPSDVPSGAYPNTTSPVTATVDDETLTGDPASDDLVVVAAPRLQKEFTNDPVQPGDTVTLQFTLTHSAEAPGDATGITFTDDLDAALSGLVATGLPLTDPCGPGSELAGDPDASNLSFTGGTLAPGESCSFTVTLQVPAGAPSGNHLNTTSIVQATVAGVATESAPATDLLTVAVLRLTKSFLDDPVLPGATVTLQFTVQNLSPSSDATDITFTDDLNGVLSGLVATDLPKNDVCGAGSSLTASAGDTFLTLAGGTLAPGESCAFDTVLQVPAGAASDTYPNVTAAFSATVEGSTVFFPNASDQLTVDDNLLLFSKEFLDDPVAPGGTVTLRFTIESLASETASDLAFTDDLDAALTGLTSSSGTLPDVCGAGSQISGTSLLTLTGGTLPAGGSCTFDVTVQVPGSAPLGTVAVNTTSEATGTVGGLGVTGDPASDTLQILAITFAKSFDGPTAATGNPVLTFTITNLDAGSGVSQLAFIDDLEAVLPGLVAVAPLPADPCGAGSTLSGSSVLTLSGGSLAAAGQPGDSCTFAVTLQVPPDAAPGDFPNTTSDLTSAGLQVAEPATATLAVEPPPGFGKSFAPDSIGVGQTSTLTFTIVNTASAVDAMDLAFADTLPAGVEVASPPAASTTCSGGTITAVAGGGTVSYTGGSVAAGASCSVQVDVIATAPGTHLNTSGALTSSSGSSGTASDTLTAGSQPLFTKSFAPTEIDPGGVSTLTFTIDNSASPVAATGLSFTDDLPDGMLVADPPNASTTCTGGTLTAMAGDTQVSYTGGSVAAGAVCTVSVDVTAFPFGDAVNRVELVSALGSSGEATATLRVLGSLLEIPTLAEWGLALLASLLFAAGLWRLRG